MKLLMIDNYDSFTYNIVQYFGELGAEVEVFRNDEITLDAIEARLQAAQASPPGGLARPLLAVRGRHLGGGHPALCRQAADSGRVPGAPEHRRGLWRQDHAGPAAHAWQDQRHHHHAGGRVRRAAAAVHGEPLPLAGHRARQLPRVLE
jgi:hypothetical protein